MSDRPEGHFLYHFLPSDMKFMTCDQKGRYGYVDWCCSSEIHGNEIRYYCLRCKKYVLPDGVRIRKDSHCNSTKRGEG